MSDDLEPKLETILRYSDEYGVQNPDAPQTEWIESTVGIDLELMK